jgi:hypothetical protein
MLCFSNAKEDTTSPRVIYLVWRRGGPACAFFDKKLAEKVCKKEWPESDWVQSIPINYGVPYDGL